MRLSTGKTCPKCQRDDVRFGQNRSRKDGLTAYCRECYNAIEREKRLQDGPSDRKPSTARERMAAAARAAVRRAVKSGAIEKVERCIACGQGPTEAHHYRGYARRFWLYVKWLCRSCHQLDHKNA